MTVITEKIMQLLQNVEEIIAKGIEEALVNACRLDFSTIKEVPAQDLTPLLGIVPDGDRFFVADGLLISVTPTEEVINPYENEMNVWEDLLEEEGLSSYNLPFRNFYFYYSQYQNWLSEEELTEDDTNFSDYLLEMHGIDDYSSLRVPETESINVSEIRNEIVYHGKILTDLNKALTEVQTKSDAFELMLANADVKRAEFTQKKEVLLQLIG